MKGHDHAARARSIAVALFGAVTAIATIGATAYEWAPIGKDDRVASVADCRSAADAAGAACTGVALPRTFAEATEVMPGLSIVEQVER